jgi:HrpA-like RNA helicase
MHGADSIMDDNSFNSVDPNEIVHAPRVTAKIDDDFIARLVLDIAQRQWQIDASQNQQDDKENGSILIFLPGKGEIEALSRSLYKIPQLGNKSKCSILQLHSSLSPSEQWRAFKPVKYGVVKVILSTNVAETSVTIADVSNVIDTGRVKEMRFNSSTRIKELVTVWTSLASTKQRAGRAGRTSQGTCHKLYSESFAQDNLPAHTSPEIMRIPLEELVLQVCLLEEQRTSTGASPIDFLANAPQPPSEARLLQACEHLLEIGALNEISGGSKYRLTPLGYHLAHLPLDAKVGKILVVGCILQCIEPALTIAANLSAPKSFWLPFIPGVNNSKEDARKAHEDIIRNGYGGIIWPGGSVKGDIIASIAAYNAWSKGGNDKLRRQFAMSNALDHNVLNEIKGLRSQFRDALKSSGLLQSRESDNLHGDDALLTSCCIVAGLYPNIATLLRPSRERKIRVARLITKNGDCCRPSSSSFQHDRIRNCSENGSDAYAVYHGKHVSIGAGNGANDLRKKQEPFISDINFVSRFAILLFGGQIEIKQNCLFVDDWLKFKVDDSSDDSQKISDKNRVNAILIDEVRKELDNVMLKRIIYNGHGTLTDNECDEDESERVINVIKTLLTSGK